VRRVTTVVVLGILIGLLPLASAGAAPARIQREPVRWHMQSGHEHGSPVGPAATAKLVRTSRGLSYSLNTNQLNPGHAYTLWVVVINDPAACSETPCSPQDILLTADTDAQISYGTGHVVGDSGEAGFGGTLRRGPIPTGWLPDQGLDNPLGAQVHLVVNDHGPVLPEFMPEMIQTYRAGCTDESLPPIFPDTAKADGTPGPNTCRLFQVAVFQ
jgi:hypothetical protein